VPGGISIGIDISGNDIYDSKKDRFAQGSGILGIGMIVDFNGDDKYFAGDMAQGCGIYGVGLVADFSGDDIYRMGLMGQGFGVFGAGMLLDRVGNDTYMIRGMGQGAGSTMGIGSLCDLSGNDKYLADKNKKRGRLNPDKWSHVQGAGFSIRSPDWTRHLSIYGGIGFLNDGGGNDFYFASDGNSMGSSYFMSLGALVDHSGNDRYLPQNGSGLAYAVHLANAVVIDRAGNDYYFASTHSGGVGSDRSLALLIDYSGDDVYGPSEAFVTEELKNTASRKDIELTEAEIGREVQTKLADVSYGSALKPKALGFLIDVNGNDRYFARQNGWGESLGGIIPPVEPENWSFAFLIDLNGTDLYSKPGRRDNSYVTYFDHGLCYDTEFSGTLGISEDVQPDNRRLQPGASATMSEFLQSALYVDLQDLLNPDLFVRYQVLGRIVEGPDNLSADILRFLSISPDSELNRDLIETLLIRIDKRKLDLNNNRKFEVLLSANDANVRRFAARTLGWFRIQSAETALVTALGEEHDDIRSDIIWALGRMNSASVMDPLETAIQKDSSLICRRSAVAALSHVMRRPEDLDLAQIQKSKTLFIAMLDDPDEIIRTHAAGALEVLGNEPDTIEALKHSLEDHSVYVQRAAAKSLALSGTKAGIPVLIETLRYPSIDTFKHYDHDLIKDIAYYTGVDFPEEKRYNYHTWHRWWQANGRGLNLQLNLAIMKKIKSAFRAPHEESGISIFEQLLAENPDNAVVKRRYGRFCYEWITYRLLTRRNVNQEILKRCLRLQKILVKLEPDDPESIASMAYFLARLNKLDEAIAAMQKAIHLDPEDLALRKKLELYLELREQS
jgi:HEAT repeat protein